MQNANTVLACDKVRLRQMELSCAESEKKPYVYVGDNEVGLQRARAGIFRVW
jgi:hypothetical protein